MDLSIVIYTSAHFSLIFLINYSFLKMKIDEYFIYVCLMHSTYNLLKEMHFLQNSVKFFKSEGSK